MAFSGTNDACSERKQMDEACCFSSWINSSDTDWDEYKKRMLAIVELVCRLEKEGQDWTSCCVEWDSERDLPVVPRWPPSARTATAGVRNAVLAAAIVTSAAAVVTGVAVISTHK
uniref:Transmembrane protein n=1 Tax=Oryza brachyantha TaxID=4533 RepID=J3NA62_ORYBR